MAYPTSQRGISRNILRNSLKGGGHGGRYITEKERERIMKENKDLRLNKRQSVFGAIFKQRQAKKDLARKTQAR